MSRICRVSVACRHPTLQTCVTGPPGVMPGMTTLTTPHGGETSMRLPALRTPSCCRVTDRPHVTGPALEFLDMPRAHVLPALSSPAL